MSYVESESKDCDEVDLLEILGELAGQQSRVARP
jgi:hypothetical protein